MIALDIHKIEVEASNSLFLPNLGSTKIAKRWDSGENKDIKLRVISVEIDPPCM